MIQKSYCKQNVALILLQVLQENTTQLTFYLGLKLFVCLGILLIYLLLIMYYYFYGTITCSAFK